MEMEETIQQIKEMLARSESRDVIAHCDHMIENNPEADKKQVAQLYANVVGGADGQFSRGDGIGCQCGLMTGTCHVLCLCRAP